MAYVQAIQKYLTSISFEPDSIITIHKGGLIPSAMLSYLLKTSEIYDFKIGEGGVVYPKDILQLNMKKVIIVDNIIERGEKLSVLLEFLRNFSVQQTSILTLVQKECESPLLTPSFSASMIKKEEWAVFPWESLDY